MARKPLMINVVQIETAELGPEPQAVDRLDISVSTAPVDVSVSKTSYSGINITASGIKLKRHDVILENHS
jgi:hypothetical protein